MKDSIERVLEALINWIDDGDNLVERLTGEQLNQRTGLSPIEIKGVIKSLYEEGCLILSRSSTQTPPDFRDVSISAEAIKKYAKLLAEKEAENKKEVEFKKLVHPVVIESSYRQFRDGHLRDAVLNAIIAVFTMIRVKAGLDLDGDKLATRAFSVDNPMLTVSDLTTSSGKDDQSGFMNILQGAYRSIRNPKAHSLEHDLDEVKARQYLVFASILARRVEGAEIVQ
jgi:uncharacterized protein (TIGR02391 family)